MKKDLNSKLSWFIAIFCCAFFAQLTRISSASAQAGKMGVLSGECIDSATGAPLPGVTVRAMLQSDTTFVRYSFTNSIGKYMIRNLFSGMYNVRFTILGYQDVNGTANVIDDGQAILKVEMSEQPLSSEDVVVTASRHEEKETHSPASISVVSSEEISDQIDANPTDALKNVPGMDVASEGIGNSTYSSRSFHSVFGSDVLTMNDYHSMEVPAIGGFYGILMPQNMDDIDHIEVIRGPGSALYGPEAATGVVNFISKSPFASQGTNLSIAGGERNYLDAGFRHDEAIGDKFAFNVSGHYLKANDWEVVMDTDESKYRDTAQAILNTPSRLSAFSPTQQDSLRRIGNRDYNLEVYSLNARMDANLSDDLTANVTGGLTNITNDVAMTEDFGDAQIKNWLYDFVQGRVTYKDLFIQGSINHDNTSGSYFLPTGAPIVNKSSTYVAQIQNRWDPFSNEKLTYGADFQSIVPISDSTIYGPDDGHANVSIFGAYLQSQTSLIDNQLELVLAGRVDKHSYLTKPIFSPRAAAVYHFDDHNLVRAMYNETYLFPSENDLYADLFFAGDVFGFANQGLPFAPVNMRYVAPYVSGLSFKENSDGSYNMYSTILPGNPIASNQAMTVLWPKLDNLAANLLNAKHTQTDSIAAYLLGMVPAPNPQQVQTYLAYLNLHPNSSLSNVFLPVSNGQPVDISPVQPQHQSTFEVDYQGAISKSVQFEVDAYQTHYDAIRASTVALTPNVLADPASLTKYLIDSLTPKIGSAAATELADSVVAEIALLPLGVVQPSGQHANEAYPYDVLIGTRNYLENTVQFYGADFFTTVKANEEWSFDGSFSWLNKNYWYAGELNPQDSTLQTPFALNMPKYRASIGARYTGLTHGLSVELRDRWSDAFQMNDSYWVGNVSAQHVLDLTINYRVESWNSLQLTLSVSNLLNNMHQEFVGAPVIGRLAVLRASYALPSL